MTKRHYAIIIPGLGDEKGPLLLATKHWKKYGLTPLIYSIGWRNTNLSFKLKLKKFVNFIDKFTMNNNSVSLVGCSAGGSAVLNAFLKRKNHISKVINICGRLKKGNQIGFRSFNQRTSSSTSFAQSVKSFENHEKLLTIQDKQKIMTIRSLLGDELVPPDTTTIENAYNITVPTPEHIFSIFMSLTFFSKPLINFLTDRNN